jgi:hypothetical protein
MSADFSEYQYQYPVCWVLVARNPVPSTVVQGRGSDVTLPDGTVRTSLEVDASIFHASLCGLLVSFAGCAE